MQCKNNHPLNAQTLTYNTYGYRVCRLCRAAADLRHRAKKGFATYNAEQRALGKAGRYAAIAKTVRKKYPERRRAYDAVRHALRGGQLVRPNNCERCGVVCKPEAHHPDYLKPLEVIWECRACHLAEKGRQVRVTADQLEAMRENEYDARANTR